MTSTIFECSFWFCTQTNVYLLNLELFYTSKSQSQQVLHVNGQQVTAAVQRLQISVWDALLYFNFYIYNYADQHTTVKKPKTYVKLWLLKIYCLFAAACYFPLVSLCKYYALKKLSIDFYTFLHHTNTDLQWGLQVFRNLLVNIQNKNTRWCITVELKFKRSLNLYTSFLPTVNKL